MKTEHKRAFLVGFDLVGQRQPNGKLKSHIYPDQEIDDWPEEVEMFGNIYTLEDIEKGNNGYESAQYA